MNETVASNTFITRFNLRRIRRGSRGYDGNTHAEVEGGTMKAFLAAILLGVAVHAQSAQVTIDFEAHAGSGYFVHNKIMDGFRFSPVCAIVVNTDQLWGQGSYLNADADNNCGGFGDPPANNPNYLGDPDVFKDVWIDFLGKPFTLLGLDSVVPFYNAMSFEVTSSKGGHSSMQEPPVHLILQATSGLTSIGSRCGTTAAMASTTTTGGTT